MGGAVGQVCVIGAGPSGLAAAKNFIDAGLGITVFEAGDDIGGNWRFAESEGHSSVFEIIQGSNQAAGLSPADLPGAIDRELAHPDWQQLASPRHTVTVDDMAFRARLRRELPADRLARAA